MEEAVKRQSIDDEERSELSRSRKLGAITIVKLRDTNPGGVII